MADRFRERLQSFEKEGRIARRDQSIRLSLNGVAAT